MDWYLEIGITSEGVKPQTMKYLGTHRLSAGCDWLNNCAFVSRKTRREHVLISMTFVFLAMLNRKADETSLMRAFHIIYSSNTQNTLIY